MIINEARTNFDDIFLTDTHVKIQPYELKNLSTYLSKKKGWVYIAKNPAYSHLKIGRTSKSPWIRAQTLSTAGILDNFEIVYAIEFMNAITAEKYTHHLLKKERVKNNKEFFNISLDNAILKVAETKSREIKNMERYFNGDIYQFDLSLLENASFEIKETSYKINL